MDKIYYYEVQGIDLKNNRTFYTMTSYKSENNTDTSIVNIKDIIKQDYINQGYDVKYIRCTHLCLVNDGLTVKTFYRDDICYSEDNFIKIELNIKIKQ